VLCFDGTLSFTDKCVPCTRYRLANIGQRRLEKNSTRSTVEDTVTSVCMGFLYVALVQSERASVVLIGNQHAFKNTQFPNARFNVIMTVNVIIIIIIIIIIIYSKITAL